MSGKMSKFLPETYTEHLRNGGSYTGPNPRALWTLDSRAHLTTRQNGPNHCFVNRRRSAIATSERGAPHFGIIRMC